MLPPSLHHRKLGDDAHALSWPHLGFRRKFRLNSLEILHIKSATALKLNMACCYLNSRQKITGLNFAGKGGGTDNCRLLGTRRVPLPGLVGAGEAQYRVLRGEGVWVPGAIGGGRGHGGGGNRPRGWQHIDLHPGARQPLLFDHRLGFLEMAGKTGMQGRRGLFVPLFPVGTVGGGVH